MNFTNFGPNFQQRKRRVLLSRQTKKANGKQNEMENRIYTCLINLTASKRLQIDASCHINFFFMNLAIISFAFGLVKVFDKLNEHLITLPSNVKNRINHNFFSTTA